MTGATAHRGGQEPLCCQGRGWGLTPRTPHAEMGHAHAGGNRQLMCHRAAASETARLREQLLGMQTAH